MEKRKRRSLRQSEGDAAATVSQGGEPTLLLLSPPPRKRAVSLSASTPPGLPPPSTVGTISSSDASDLPAVDEPVLGRVNPTAALPPLALSVVSQPPPQPPDGDANGRGTVVLSLEQTFSQEAFLPRLIRAYDSFHDRYTRMKTRKVDIQSQFEEQRRSHERFQQVAEGYIKDLCSENQELRKTVNAAEKRINYLELLLCQTDEFRASIGRKQEIVLQKASCEIDVAVSPVRPLTPASDDVAAEEKPIQAELQSPSEHLRQHTAEESAECCVESKAPNEDARNREMQPWDMALESNGPPNIGVTEEKGGLQMLTVDNAALRENVLIQEAVEPSLLTGEHLVASTETSLPTTFAATQMLKSPVDEAVLGLSLQRPRSPEGSAPVDVDTPMVVCSEPVIPCLPNRPGSVDLLRNSVERQDLHQKEVAGLLSEVEILQEVLGYFIDMTVVSEKSGRVRRSIPTLILLHPKTGFRFRLEVLKELEVQMEASYAQELSYQNLSLGTLIGVAPWWMKEEIVFTVDQLVNFLRKFQETVTGIPNRS